MRGPVTIKDIARVVGISPSAVSLALRSSPKIGKATRERVQAVAREMDYRPNPMAAALTQFRRSSQTKPVQAALAWVNFWHDPKRLRGFGEFECYWQGAKASARNFGYRLEEFICKDLMPPSRLMNILLSRGINGILVPPGPLPFEWRKNPSLEHFAIVRFGRASEDLPVHGVTSCQVDNAMLALKVTLEKGYKRVGFVGTRWVYRHFGAGYLWITECGFPPDMRLPPLLLEEEAPASDKQRDFASWLTNNSSDAIITDRPEVMSMLEKAGYRVPEDIGLVSLNVLDTPFDAGIYPNPEEAGRVAVLLLHSLIHDNDRGFPAMPRQILIPGKWVDGASLPPRVSRSQAK